MSAIRIVTPSQAEALREPLIDLLVDSVESGGSVNFVWPMSRQKSEDWWAGALQSHARGERVILVAEEAGRVLGSVQLIFPGQENQAHRADVGKLLVHTSARRRGLGEALMLAVETEARRLGRRLLVLDTEAGGAGDRLYERLGWTRFGVVPGYASSADTSHLADCAFFYKAI
jgi:GNAT superfamily N-acetyltransferase